ncbi:lysine 2,3-aminomutase [Nocardia sp. NBC_00565]|uniref:KamA family radical SAM protein n=1 Tax=Nocardia sp. NBC_00565 TaxID=2975993 RepID=UPI002E805A8F|nr:lysine 2,3-aminomutase [Nocardia sp. NBC_00565]WUC07701.1 lysine 2,3-aminomutase [Nocardia sp. NBC_00565]
MKIFTGERLAELARQHGLSKEYLRELRIVSSVLPFRVNNYVEQELIDWTAAPEDPIFRLTFPHRDMLPPTTFAAVAALHDAAAPQEVLAKAGAEARRQLNPHPGGQIEANVPVLHGNPVIGLQHKYRETLLVFPSPGQTCHSYCGYCFRWAQFVGSETRQALSAPAVMTAYLHEHPEVTDVLFTGGDPMIMKTAVLSRWVEPLLSPGLEHIRTLRFGTKAMSYWPARFTDDNDADDLLRLLARCVAAGRHVAVMAHFSHPRELSTATVRRAIARVRDTGAVIRAQAPLVAHVNDDAATWAEMWQRLVEAGVIPYYMFVERDTGARNYFEVPLARALDIYTDAVRSVSGLARTARGPVMSTHIGKVALDGAPTILGTKVFALRLLQSRDPGHTGLQYFAHYDPAAVWLDDLRPALGTSIPGRAESQ